MNRRTKNKISLIDHVVFSPTRVALPKQIMQNASFSIINSHVRVHTHLTTAIETEVQDGIFCRNFHSQYINLKHAETIHTLQHHPAATAPFLHNSKTLFRVRPSPFHPHIPSRCSSTSYTAPENMVLKNSIQPCAHRIAAERSRSVPSNHKYSRQSAMAEYKCVEDLSQSPEQYELQVGFKLYTARHGARCSNHRSSGMVRSISGTEITAT